MKTLLKTFIIISTAILMAGASTAQENGWEKSFDIDLTATQSSYSDSWSGGEAGSFSWAGNANGIFSKQLYPKFNLKNTVKFAFGQTHTQDKESKNWYKPTKSTDKIDLESVGLYTLNTFVDPYAAFRFESQFLDASDEAHKEYVDPILLTFSVGIARQILKKEKNDILTRLGFALKHNRDKLYDADNEINETKTGNDGGLESNTDIRLVLNDKLAYTGKLTLYKAFFYSEKDDYAEISEKDYWKTIDINWENKITASISKYIQVSLYAQLLYDKQIDKRGRLKETLAMGLTYKLF